MSAIKANQVLNLDGDRIGSVVVDSIANMKNLNPEIEANATVELLGYYSKGDGGGGTFYWDSTSIEDDNGGTIIEATGVVDGRWIRNYKGAVNVKWFGAKGDGIVDDTVAIQAAIDYVNLKKGGEVYLPSGTFSMSNTLILKENVHLKGSFSTSWDTSNGTILKNSTTDVIHIGDSNNLQGFGLSFITIQGNISNIGLRTYNGANDILLYKISIHNCSSGVIIDRSWTLDANRVATHSCINGFEFVDSSSGGGMTSLTFNNCGVYNSSGIGWNFIDDGVEYSSLYNCFVDGASVGINYSAASRSISFYNFGFESITNTLVSLNNSNLNISMYSPDLGIHTSGQVIFNITDVANFTISNMKVFDVQVIDSTFSTFGANAKGKASLNHCNLTVNSDFTNFNMINTETSQGYGMLYMNGVEYVEKQSKIELSISNRANTFSTKTNKYYLSCDAVAAGQALTGTPIFNIANMEDYDVLKVYSVSIGDHDVLLRSESHTSGTGIVMHPDSSGNTINLDSSNSYCKLMKMPDGKLHQLEPIFV